MATRVFVGSLGLGILNSALLWPYLISKASVGFILTVQITTFAIFGALTYQIWLGRNWARITVLLLGILGLPSYIPTLRTFLSVSFVAGFISLLQMRFRWRRSTSFLQSRVDLGSDAMLPSPNRRLERP
jgi:hypothetical protein